jgi:hypothetical protein
MKYDYSKTICVAFAACFEWLCAQKLDWVVRDLSLWVMHHIDANLFQARNGG